MTENEKMMKNKKMEKEFKLRIAAMREKEPDKPNGLIQPNFVSCDFENKSVVYEFPILDWELNFKGVLHGGVLAIIFDMSMGLLANYFCPGFAPTSNINVNFLKPGPRDETILLTARITSAGKRLVSVYGEAFLKSSGVMMANGFGTFAVTNLTRSFDSKR